MSSSETSNYLRCKQPTFLLKHGTLHITLLHIPHNKENPPRIKKQNAENTEKYWKKE